MMCNINVLAWTEPTGKPVKPHLSGMRSRHINMALGQCRTVEDVKLMIMEMASSIEMREQAL